MGLNTERKMIVQHTDLEWKMSEANVRKYIENFPDNTKGVALDIGANIGMYTDLIASKFSDVIAFEPHPENFTQLLRNSKAPNVTFWPYAVANTNAIVPLYLSSHPGCHTIMDQPHHMMHWGFHKDDKIMVQGITLDFFINKDVKFIKCDVEGGEDTLFYAGEELLLSNEMEIILEVHVDIDHEKLYKFFVMEMGYSVRSLDTDQIVTDFKSEMHYLLSNRW